MSTLHFPEGFLWGSATAAHQVEGGNVGNDWWDWEHTPGSGCAESSADGCDHFHRYPQDMAMLASLGHNAYRFSLEWSRIEPAEGEFSLAALDHYRRMLGCAHENGLVPLLTLHHFTSPRWFAARGGFASPDAPRFMARFAERAMRHLGDLVPYAFTINEPQGVVAGGYVLGHFPPGHRDLDEAVRVTRSLIDCHAAAADAVRSASPRTKTGIVLALIPMRPANPESKALTETYDHLATGVWLDGLRTGTVSGLGAADGEVPHLRGSCDVLGVNYYGPLTLDAADPLLQQRIASSDDNAEDADRSQMGTPTDPSGLVTVLRRAATVGVPLMVTENGIATADDSRRVAYLRDHIAAAHSVLEEVDLRGYIVWSSMDNFEWSRGYAKTFGLIGIDRADGLRRMVRPSAHWFARVATSNALEVEDGVAVPARG